MSIVSVFPSRNKTYLSKNVGGRFETQFQFAHFILFSPKDFENIHMSVDMDIKKQKGLLCSQVSPLCNIYTVAQSLLLCLILQRVSGSTTLFEIFCSEA